MMIRKLLMGTTSLALALTLAGCQDTATDTTTDDTTETTTETTAPQTDDTAIEETVETEETETGSDEEAADSDEVSRDNPIVVDEEEQAIYLYTEVNGDVLDQGTQHGVVYTEGGNDDVSLFLSHIEPVEVHDALTQLGAEPGDNLTMEDLELPEGEGKAVEGTALDVTISWDGQDEIPFTDVLVSENDGVAAADFRFGGHLEANNEMDTGCTICLYSCPIGIISNAAVPTDEFADLEVTADAEALPADGEEVVFKIQLAE